MSGLEPKRPNHPHRRLPPEVLTDGEVGALLVACGSDGMTELRNRALVAVLYRAGLRISEALALCPKDLDLRTGTVRVLHGKGGWCRTSGIDAGAAEIVRAWMEARTAWAGSSTERDRLPLFCTHRGEAVSAGYVRRLLPALARAAGIAKRVHAHGLRHTHASELRAEGVDIGIISKQLGHRSILTTIRYLDHIAPVAVVEAVKKRVWNCPQWLDVSIHFQIGTGSRADHR